MPCILIMQECTHAVCTDHAGVHACRMYFIMQECTHAVCTSSCRSARMPYVLHHALSKHITQCYPLPPSLPVM